MRTEPFTERLEVDLTEEERGIRGRQAARQAKAIEAYKAVTKKIEEDAAALKKLRKTTEEEMTAALFATSTIAETGKEEREVPCEEVLLGVMVETRRKGGDRHGEFVSSRPATRAEMSGNDAPKSPKGYTAEEKIEKLRAGIARLTVKPRTEEAVLKALVKGVPEATAMECKAAVVALLEEAKLVEDGGKLAWIGTAPASAPDEDEGIVPDDYTPVRH